MQSINQKSIRWESVKSIFNVIADAEKISRADIAEATGLSLMTVGKIADTLTELGIVRQSKESRNAAGRRAGILSLSPNYCALILDFTGAVLSFSVLTAGLHLHKEIPCSYNGSFTYEENIGLFLKEAQAYMASLDTCTCMGIGVVLPAPLDHRNGCACVDARSPLYGLPIAAKVRQAFPALPVYFETSVYAAAISNVLDVSEHADQVILYCFTADGCVQGAISQGGVILRGAHGVAGNFGRMALSRGRTLASAIRKENPIRDNAAEIAKMLHNVILTVDPDTVALESELPGSTNAFIDLLKEELCTQYGYTEDTLPLFKYSQCPYRHAHRGLALQIREAYLYREIIGEDIQYIRD